MRRVYLDTVGLLALWNARDQWHEAATRALVELTTGGAEFWTSTPILLECGNAAARMPFRHAVVELRQQLLSDSKLIEPAEEDLVAAWDAYARGGAGDAGIVDEVYFAVMRRLVLRHVSIDG